MWYDTLRVWHWDELWHHTVWHWDVIWHLRVWHWDEIWHHTAWHLDEIRRLSVWHWGMRHNTMQSGTNIQTFWMILLPTLQGGSCGDQSLVPWRWLQPASPHQWQISIRQYSLKCRSSTLTCHHISCSASRYNTLYLSACFILHCLHSSITWCPPGRGYLTSAYSAVCHSGNLNMWMSSFCFLFWQT